MNDKQMLTWPRVEYMTQSINAYLPCFCLLQAGGRRVEVFERINVVRQSITGFEWTCFYMICQCNAAGRKFDNAHDASGLAVFFDGEKVVLTQA